MEVKQGKQENQQLPGERVSTDILIKNKTGQKRFRFETNVANCGRRQIDGTSASTLNAQRSTLNASLFNIPPVSIHNCAVTVFCYVSGQSKETVLVDTDSLSFPKQ